MLTFNKENDIIPYQKTKGMNNMFSIITLKQLNNTLKIFKKNKIETEEAYVNNVKFLVKRGKKHIQVFKWQKEL